MRTLSILLSAATPLAALDLEMLTPPGEATSFGRILAVSTGGDHMAGEVIRLAGLETEAATWSATGGMSLVSIEPQDPAGEAATGISDDGRVVAGWHMRDRGTGFIRRTGASNPVLTNNQNYKVLALSPDGSVAVGKDATRRESINNYACRWDTTTGARTTVSDLSGGVTDAAFLAISADKATCVGYGVNGSGRAAVRSVNGGALSVVGELGGGRYFSEARGVSADGSVIVGRSLSANGMEAFRWTSSGIEGLGDLPGGAFVSEACSVSDDGQVVVGVAESELGPEVFVWLEDRGMRSLRTVAKAGGIDLDGWHFGGAWPVLSGNGNVLALNATDPGQAPRLLRLSGLRGAADEGDPPPVVAGFKRGNRFRVGLETEPGLRYQLQCSETMGEDADWENVGSPVTGDGSMAEFEAPADAPACYFRLVTVP
jgi:probable HAF family extracellular repeat protein